MSLPRHKILVAEDSAEDIFFLARAFRKAGMDECLVTVRDGQEAISYLSEEPRPDLLLLDLKMPKMNGFDVLRWVRANPEMRNLPVVVFSSSDLPEDKERAKELGAREYFVKGSNWEEFVSELSKKFLQG